MKKFYNLLIITLFVVGAFLRLYNFPNRLIFGPEQGMSLSTAADNLTKFSLLGETNFQRATTAGHIPFHGAYYSYFLIPFLLLFNFRVLPMTLVFVSLNLITAFIFFIFAKKFFGKTVAAFSLFYFLTNTVMIHHSLFTWILNPLPLLGVLTFWILLKARREPVGMWSAFFLGFMTGFGFGLQNLYLPFGVATFLIFLLNSKKQIFSPLLFFVFGDLLGNLPMVIFDFRHDFYHVRTLWQYFQDVYVTHAVSGFTDYYHFLYLFPLLFLLLAIATSALLKISKPLALILPIVFLYTSFTSPFFNLRQSTGMPNGLTLASLESAAATIAADQPPTRFNVATLWDFDTLARPMRYLLQYYHGLTPQNFADYGNVDALYVFAPKDRDINKPEVWELNTFMPYRVTLLSSPSPLYRLYKLTK